MTLPFVSTQSTISPSSSSFSSCRPAPPASARPPRRFRVIASPVVICLAAAAAAAGPASQPCSTLASRLAVETSISNPFRIKMCVSRFGVVVEAVMVAGDPNRGSTAPQKPTRPPPAFKSSIINSLLSSTAQISLAVVLCCRCLSLPPPAWRAETNQRGKHRRTEVRRRIRACDVGLREPHIHYCGSRSSQQQ